jgi:hypothetical protein
MIALFSRQLLSGKKVPPGFVKLILPYQNVASKYSRNNNWWRLSKNIGS